MFLEIALMQQMVVVDAPTRPVTSLALVVGLFSSTAHIFPLAEQVFSSIRVLLATTKLCMLLLHPQGYHAMLIIAKVHSITAGKDCWLFSPSGSLHSTRKLEIVSPTNKYKQVTVYRLNRLYLHIQEHIYIYRHIQSVSVCVCRKTIKKRP